MIKVIVELPGLMSIKEKRRIIKSLKDKIRVKYKVSVSETDLNDSHSYTELGAALVSNSKEFGEKVMHKILLFLEEKVPGRLADVAIKSEYY